jgi:hypothetical protein
MIVVTGSAPRCGTSAMMRLLVNEYKPHSYAELFPSYVAKEKNPEGYWDMGLSGTQEQAIPYEKGSVIKLWAPMFTRIDATKVKLLVVMNRANFVDQVSSIYSTGISEGLGPLSPRQISSLFHNQQSAIDKVFTDTPKLKVMMNDLRKNPGIILSKIKEILLWEYGQV